MASTTGISLNKAIIPLVPLVKEEDYLYVTLSNTFVDVNGDLIKKKTEVPKIHTEDKECMLRFILEFDEAMEPPDLNAINDGPTLYALFRQVVSGTIRDEWDLARQGLPQTVAGFQQAIDRFLCRYFLSTDLADQRRYLDTTTKPMKLNASALASRLRYINNLLAALPGANNTAPYDELGLKTIYYNLMWDKWKLAFLTTGQDFSANTYTLLQLARFMTIQENAAAARKNSSSRREVSRRGRLRNAGRNNRRAHSQDRRENSPNQRNVCRRVGGNCPFEGHQNHDWSECFGNPESPNYRPGFNLPAVRVATGGGQGRVNQRNNRGRNNNRRNNQDVHHVNKTATHTNGGSGCRRNQEAQVNTRGGVLRLNTGTMRNETAGARLRMKIWKPLVRKKSFGWTRLICD